MEPLAFQFNIAELLCLFGLTQSVYILVYIAFRSGRFSDALIPVLFFLTLGSAFLLGAAKGQWQSSIPYYDDIQWGLWASCVPLSVLLILQVSRISKAPPVFFWLVLLFVPVTYISSLWLEGPYGERSDWLNIGSIILGALSLLLIWSKRNWLDGLLVRKNGKERWWLIICLLVMNIGLLILNLMAVNNVMESHIFEIIRIIIGISFAYIASTSLFRIYPQTGIIPIGVSKDNYLSPDEIEFALKVENLLNLEKVYQEPAYGRADMAKELSITESALSKIVNIYFEKSVPQLLNEHRVDEAKILLLETQADITTICSEAGFNSIATFNRVFKEIEGISPTQYRKKE